MAEAVVGALRVNLGIDTAQFSRGMQAVEGRLAKFQKMSVAVGAVAGTALIGALTGVAAGIGKAINEMDRMGKMAQSIGLPVDQLLRLKYAAELSDVSVETLAKSVVKLNERMAAAVKDGSSPAAESFKALGIEVQNTDGSLRQAIDIMADLADKFAGFQDGALKSAAAGEFFGKKLGADLIPMLNQGGAAFRKTMAEADKFREIYGPDKAAAAEQFNDNLTRLSGATDLLATRLAVELAPNLARATDLMVTLASNADAVATGITKIGLAIPNLLSGLMIVLAVADQLKRIMGIDPVAIGSWITTIQGLTAEEQAYLDSLVRASEAERARNAIHEEGKQVALEMRTEQEVINDRIARYNELLQASAISWDVYVKAVASANDELNRLNLTLDEAQAKNRQSAFNTAQNWLDVADTVAGAGQSMFSEQKGFAYAAAVVNTAQAITKTMAEYGFTPIGIAAMSAAALAGAAQIAAINRARPGSGGSVPSAGPKGGASVAAAAGGGGGRASSAPRQTVYLTVQSKDPASVREMAAALAEIYRDGNTDLKFTD